MSDRDAYEVLQVQPGAHQLVVQAAFRVLASIYHPDRDSSAVANRMMVELNVAYAKVPESGCARGLRPRAQEPPSCDRADHHAACPNTQ